MSSLAREVAVRRRAVEHAFAEALMPALEAVDVAEDEAEPLVDYLASAFCEEARLVLGEEEVDEDVEVSDGSGSEAAPSSLTKAQRHARNKALKKKGGRRAALGEGTFGVKRRRQLSHEQAAEVIEAQVLEALSSEMSDDSAEAAVPALLLALVAAGAVRDVDDDAFDLITDDVRNSSGSGGGKAEEHEVTEGASCVALLSEDNDWHVAVVKELLDGDRFRVVFTDWGKPQVVTRTQLVLDVDRVDLRDDVDEGECELCSRHTPLTAHHLIPRQMHTKYLKKGLSQDFLNTCAMICRKCHNVVHRFKTNAELAESFSTVDKLLDAPYIQRWVAYISSRPAPTKAERDAQLRLAK